MNDNWMDNVPQRKEFLRLIAEKVMSEVGKYKYDCRPKPTAKHEPFWEFQNWKIHFRREPDDVRFIFETNKGRTVIYLSIHVNARNLITDTKIDLKEPDLFEKSAEFIIEAINYKGCRG